VARLPQHQRPAAADRRRRLPAAPFSAWYTAAEIGARNLADDNRYAMLPAVARGMGLDTSNDRTLWKDRALVELTTAVLHSFDQAGVSIIDHTSPPAVRPPRTARARSRPAHPGPLGADRAADRRPRHPVWQRRYEPTILRPNFYQQPAPWVEGRGPKNAETA